MKNKLTMTFLLLFSVGCYSDDDQKNRDENSLPTPISNDKTPSFLESALDSKSKQLIGAWNLRSSESRQLENYSTTVYNVSSEMKLELGGQGTIKKPSGTFLPFLWHVHADTIEFIGIDGNFASNFFSKHTIFTLEIIGNQDKQTLELSPIEDGAVYIFKRTL
jgi:hypothetical protein